MSYLGITSVTFPSTLLLLDESSLSNCFQLSSIKFAENCKITDIAANSFKSCIITTFHVPRYLERITGSAFNGVTTIQELTIDKNNLNFVLVENFILYDFSKTNIVYFASAKTEEYTIPSGTKSLGTGSFYSSQLSTLILPDSLTSIEDYCFSKSTISSFTIPDSVTKIGSNAFNSCSQLKTIQLPSKLKQLNGGLFSGSGLTSISIPDSVEKIGNNVFSNCKDLGEISLPENLKSLGGSVIDKSPNAYYVFKGSNIYINEENIIINSDNTTIIQYLGNDLTTINIPETVQRIKASAFKGKTSIQTVTCKGQSNLKFIEHYAFSDCVNLQNFIGFEFVSFIGEYTFSNTNLGSDIVFGNDLYYIGESAFSNCKKISSLTFSSNVFLTIGNNAFSKCSSISSLNFDACTDNIAIGSSSFNGLTSLKSLNLSYNINSTGSGCFSDCGLVDVSFQHSFLGSETIPISMFMNCYNLKNIEFPKNVVHIGALSFCNTSITKVVLPDSVRELGLECFKGCTLLQSLIISNTSKLQLINYGAFSGCYSFSKIEAFKSSHFMTDYGALYTSDMTKMIVYPAASTSKFFALAFSLRSIAESAFIGCINLESILIPDNTVTSIGRSAFEGCVNLKNINIPMSVTEIGENAFLGCRSLLCGSINYENKSLSFREKLINAGLNKNVLSACKCVTCRATYYSSKSFIIYVFLLIYK